MNASSARDELRELEVEYQGRTLSAFDPGVLLRLAAVPEWTGGLAAAVGVELGDVDRLEAAGLVESREVVDDEGEVATAFWMPASRRPDIGAHLRRLWPTDRVVGEVRDLADLVDRAGPPAAGLEPWLAVVRGHLVGAATGDLVFEVDAMLRAGLGDRALRVVGAAQALGDLVGDPLVSAARRAQWRIDRGYREAVDAAALTHYLPRPAVEELIAGLVSGSSGTWAAHLRGGGGVGKTMAVRDLASGRFAARHGLRPFPVARVDFDHLDPRYPHRRPGELVLALATDLMGFTGTRAAYYHRRQLDDAIATLHERVAAGSDRVVGPDGMEPVVDAFARYVGKLPGPVLLVLDTCEELAKLYGPGGRAPAVDHTFALLESVHERTPGVRVLLAGRRWLVPPPTKAESAGLTLAPRPYLDVLPLGGFTREEAHAYLSLRDERGTLSAAMRDAVVLRAAHDGAGVSPFELAGYCEWALDEPDLDVRRLLADTGDPYVRQRVIGRVTNAAVRDCLPAAAELGRFDLRMIEPYLVRRGIDPRTAFDGLVGQEWVTTAKFDADGAPLVVELDEQLLPRLRAALAADPNRFPLDRRRLGRDLAELIGHADVDELPIEAVEGALRLLPVAEAAAVWTVLERRITEADAWAWAGQATVRAAAVEAASRPEGLTVAAAIRATQACAVTRLPGAPGVVELWNEVVVLAVRHPDPAQADLLAFRAVCGLVASGGPVGDGTDLARRWAALDPETARGPMIALVDALTARDEVVPSVLVPVLDRLAAAEPEIAVTALAATVLRRLYHWNRDGAIDAAERGIGCAHAGPARRWADWTPPPLLDRARLVRVVVALHGHERFDPRFAQWRDDALADLDDVDGERLAAAVIELEHRWHPVAHDILELVAALEGYRRRVPTHTWHRRVPALRTVVSIGLAAHGDLGRAVADLKERREVAVSAGDDPATIAGCDAALTTLCRRYRVRELTSSMRRLTRSEDSAVRASAWTALALVEGMSPRTPGEVGGWRHWWQAQIVPPEARGYVDHLPPPSDDPVDVLHDAEFHSTMFGTQADAVVVRSAVRAIGGRAPLSDEHVAAVLRAAVMLDDWELTGELGGMPVRHTAEIALAEAELLALRQPGRAVPLLSHASGLFRASSDATGALRAAILLVLTMSRAGADTAELSAVDLPDVEETFRLLGRDWADQRRVVEELRQGRLRDQMSGFPELHGSPTDVEVPGESAGPRPAQDAEQWQRTTAVNLREFYTARCDMLALQSGVLDFVTGPPGSRAPEAGGWGPYAVLPVLIDDDDLVAGKRPVDVPTGGKAPLRVWFRLRYRDPLRWTWRPVVVSNNSPDARSARFHGPAGVRGRTVPGAPCFHLVGTALQTAAGWRMRVEDDYIPQGGPYAPSGRSTFTGESLLGPDDLPSGDTSLVVLQAEPVDGPPRPLEHLRESMCRLALEFGDAGVAVIVVPPLPDSIARDVAGVVSTWGGERGTGAIALLDLAHVVRGVVGPLANDDVLLIV